MSFEIERVTDNSSFHQETDCIVCMNELNSKNLVAFNCNHVVCVTCAPKIIRMVAGKCPCCRDQITAVRLMSTVINHGKLYAECITRSNARSISELSFGR
jgi:hypothetical protein